MLIESPQLKRALGWIGAFALPVAAVHVAGAIAGGGGPAQVSAAVAVTESGLSPADEVMLGVMVMRRETRPTAREAAIADRIHLLRAEPFGPTPMLHTLPRPQHSAHVDDAAESTEPQPDPLPNIRLQAVMSGSESTDAMAVINGRLHSIGQPIQGTEWVLAEIHADERRVVLNHSHSNRTITLQLPVR